MLRLLQWHRLPGIGFLYLPVQGRNLFVWKLPRACWMLNERSLAVPSQSARATRRQLLKLSPLLVGVCVGLAVRGVGSPVAGSLLLGAMVLSAVATALLQQTLP